MQATQYQLPTPQGGIRNLLFNSFNNKNLVKLYN